MPKVCKIPTTNKMIIKTGNTKVIYGRIHFFTFIPLPAFASSTKLSQPQPMPDFKTQNKVNVNAPSGKQMLLTKKSSQSIIFLPAGAKSAK